MKKAIIFCAVLLISSLTHGQRIPSSPSEALYQALDIYSLGKYDEAYEKFKSFAEFYTLEGHHTIFKFMAAKSLYKGARLDQAKERFQRFIHDYPSSSYLGASYLFLGHIAYRESNSLGAAVNYIKAIDFRGDKMSAEIAAANLIPLLSRELTIEDLDYLADNYPRSDYAGEVVYYLGKRHYESSRYKRAVRTFEKYLENYTPGFHTAEVKQLYSKAREQAFKKLVIGVLAPSSGSYSDYGKEMVDGITLAFADSPKIDGKEIELLFIDTEGSPVQATKAVRSLAMEEPVVIIGPLRSESAVGAAIVSNFNNIPLITPTASEQGIAELGDHVYQVSPPAEDIATNLAEYAITDLGITEFGIIAPSDYTSREVARAFSQKVYQMGGEVLSATYYESGETDFSNQIKPLREKLLMKTEEQLAMELIDSTAYYNVDKEEWLEQEDWRVYLGGLFMPGYPDELKLLVPQVRYHVITTQYLGLDGWDSSRLMEDLERYIDGSIFATDYHPGRESDAWDEFIVKYYNKYEREPSRVSALSYDAAYLVRRALEVGATTAENVATYLDNVENYQGVSCRIDFKGTRHANNAVSIFKIYDGMLNRLE